jgi:hypothetical protein
MRELEKKIKEKRMRVVLIETCSHCHVDGCVYRQSCGMIPSECPLDTPEDVIRSYKIIARVGGDE